jgi:hypothetical protein
MNPPEEGDEPAPAIATSEPYSVKRRFSLGTVLALLTAYAALFGIMTAVGAGPLQVFVVGLFIAVVGASQALLFGGKRPRLASVVAGTLTFILLALVEVIDRHLRNRAWRPLEVRDMEAAISAGLILGPIAGYLSGVLVAGVLLITDGAHKWWKTQAASANAGRRDDATPFGP